MENTNENDVQKNKNVGALFEALAKAQGSFPPLKFDKKNPHFGSSYASLSATIETVKKQLAENGLALIQNVYTDKDDYWVETMLAHSSGATFTARMKLLIDKRTMQGIGSAITYARRYQAQAVLGLAGEDDDDGNDASGVGNKSTDNKQKNNVPPAEKKKAPITAPAPNAIMQMIEQLTVERGVHENEVTNLVVDGYGITGNTIPTWVANEIVDLLKDPACNSISVMNQVQKVRERRENAKVKKGG